MHRYHDVISSFGGKTSYDADNCPLLVMRSNLWASGYDVDGPDKTLLGQFSGRVQQTYKHSFFRSRRRHTRSLCDWSSDVCSSDLSLTLGKRFADNRLGVLIGATYDWNGRGINDIEPSPTVTSLSPHYDSIDLRDYMYYRTRWGTSGSADYRLGNGSSLALRGLYSTFRNWGQKWVYTLNDGDVPSASMDWRRPDYAVGNLVASGRHTSSQNWLTWDVSGARSRMLQSGGNGGAKIKLNGPDSHCSY